MSQHTFMSGEPPMDNVELQQWFELRRKVLHQASIELAMAAAALEARLRTVSGGRTVGGLSARKRARMVAGPIRMAAVALGIAAKYMITAYGRFIAAYMVELEAAGAIKRQTRSAFLFRADQ
ncbi:hypothetical protein [Catellatospora coxensis]|uniref:hypothetical protein n=1 Tax=Catellatospora coxensis TaxID=310354 RepID=UPI001EF27CF2|nr:hypothetical protein [Catellatospora coxensis]